MQGHYTHKITGSLTPVLLVICLWFLPGMPGPVLAEDEVETKDGQVYKGKIVKEKDSFIIMQVRILQRDVSRIDREKDRKKKTRAAKDKLKPGPGEVVITTKKGQVHKGRLIDENDRFFKLLKPTGQVTIWRRIVADIKRGPQATEPVVTRRTALPPPDKARPGPLQPEVSRKPVAANVYFYAPKKLKKKRVPAAYEKFCDRAEERVITGYKRLCTECQSGERFPCYLMGRYFVEVANQVKMRKKYRLRYTRYGLYLLEKACSGGIGVACHYLGNIIEENRANPLYGDLVRAYVFYEKGCKAEKPSGAACGVIAFAYSYNDPEFLKSTGLSYRPELWKRYLDRGCRNSAEVTRNEGKRCCEQLANAYTEGSREVAKDPRKAGFYKNAIKDSERRFRTVSEQYKKGYGVIEIKSNPLKKAKRKKKIEKKVEKIVSASGPEPEPKDEPQVTGSLTDDLGNLRAPDPFLTFVELSNLATYGCPECDNCKRNREYKYYERKLKSRGKNAPYCAAIVLACCYLKKGLYKEMDSHFELTEDQLLQLIRENRAKANEIGPCIFTCNYQQ